MGATPLLRLFDLSEKSVQLEDGITRRWGEWFAGTLNLTSHLSDEKPALSSRLTHTNTNPVSHSHWVRHHHLVKELVLQKEGSCHRVIADQEAHTGTRGRPITDVVI